MKGENMMNKSIIQELAKYRKIVKKSNYELRGYRSTEAGVVVCHSNCDKRLFVLVDENDKKFPCDHKTVYIASGTEYEGKIKSIEEAESLAKEGKFFSFDSYDLYAEYYDFANDRELENCVFNNYSLRSKEYLENTMKEIGLLKYSLECNGDILLDEDNSKIVDIQSTSLRVGKIEDEWVVEFGEGALSDYDVIRFAFNHEPTDYEMETAMTIHEFTLHPHEVVYSPEQGREINWLDIPGDLIKKYNKSKECYNMSLEQ